MKFPQLFDSEGNIKIKEAYGVFGIPETFLVDKKGIIRAVGLREVEIEKEVKKLLQK